MAVFQGKIVGLQDKSNYAPLPATRGKNKNLRSLFSITKGKNPGDIIASATITGWDNDPTVPLVATITLPSNPAETQVGGWRLQVWETAGGILNSTSADAVHYNMMLAPGARFDFSGLTKDDDRSTPYNQTSYSFGDGWDWTEYSFNIVDSEGTVLKQGKIVFKYIRLLNLADDDTLTTKSSLTRGYTLAENGTDFYFLLRDDVHFCKVENMHAVDTGEIVSAEDVVYSVERMMDKNAAPDNVNYGNFETVDSVAAITDLESLKGIQTKDGGSVYDELQKSAPSDITALTDKATDVNNASGTYQVIRLSTKYVFPQALNAFAHNAGGIVSKKQIEAVNKKFLTDPASYDVKTDMLYGDQMWYTEGAAYDNNMVCSGPYIPIKRTDYGMTFEANPYYMPTEDKYTPKIKTIEVKFISDMENAFAALRAGEIHALYCMPAEKIALANKEANLMTKEVASNAYNYCAFNFKGIFSDVNLRKAAQFAVNQEQISAVFDNRLIPTYSPLTPVLGTGKTIVADAEKSAAYLNAWREARQ